MKVANGQALVPGYNYNTNSTDLDNDDIRTIIEDPQVKSKMDIRIENANDFPLIWHTDEVKPDIVDYIKSYFKEDNLNSLDWQEFSRYVLEGLKFGYSVTELVYEKDNDQQRLKKFVSISPDNAGFDEYGVLENSETGKPINEYMKYIVFQNQIDSDNPDGRTIFTKSIYNWTVFKKRVTILLDQLLDKFGVPSIVALMENISTDPAEAQTQMDLISVAVESIRSGAGVGMANIKELITLTATGTATDFETALKIADEEIAKIILGTGVTTDSQSKGSYSNNKTSENVTFRKAKSDNRIVQKYINLVIRWLVDNRYGTEENAPFIEFDRKDGFLFDDIIKAIQNGITGISEEETFKFIPKAKDENDVLQVEIKEPASFSEKKKLIIKMLQ